MSFRAVVSYACRLALGPGLFSQLMHRLRTFNGDHGDDRVDVILAQKGCVHVGGGEVRCAFCCAYYGNLGDEDKSLHVRHLAGCQFAHATAPPPYYYNLPTSAARMPIVELGPFLRLRCGVHQQATGGGVSRLCF
ncbi:hypothetical protein BaRGS_00023917 [Batillaria attramentaria]|uniref:Uncharacterized protein n=1 Tax=Batillaria attramentaria TaxID=370345 RepID=A0ABD0KCP4_9CAEN